MATWSYTTKPTGLTWADLINAWSFYSDVTWESWAGWTYVDKL